MIVGSNIITFIHVANQAVGHDIMTTAHGEGEWQIL